MPEEKKAAADPEETRDLICVRPFAGFDEGDKIPKDSVYYQYELRELLHTGAARYRPGEPPEGAGSLEA